MSNQGQFVPFSESKTPEERTAWVEAQRALGNKKICCDSQKSNVGNLINLNLFFSCLGR